MFNSANSECFEKLFEGVIQTREDIQNNDNQNAEEHDDDSDFEYNPADFLTDEDDDGIIFSNRKQSLTDILKHLETAFEIRSLPAHRFSALTSLEIVLNTLYTSHSRTTS